MILPKVYDMAIVQPCDDKDMTEVCSARTDFQLPCSKRKCHLKVFLEVAGEGVFQGGLIFLLFSSLLSPFLKFSQPLLPSSDKEWADHMAECYSPLCDRMCAPHMVWDAGIFGMWWLCIWSYDRKRGKGEQLSHMRLCSWSHASPI